MQLIFERFLYNKLYLSFADGSSLLERCIFATIHNTDVDNEHLSPGNLDE